MLSADEAIDDLRAELRQHHYPRNYGNGLIRCPSCAEWRPLSKKLARHTWPCPTAVLAGIDYPPA